MFYYLSVEHLSTMEQCLGSSYHCGCFDCRHFDLCISSKETILLDILLFTTEIQNSQSKTHSFHKIQFLLFCHWLQFVCPQIQNNLQHNTLQQAYAHLCMRGRLSVISLAPKFRPVYLWHSICLMSHVCPLPWIWTLVTRATLQSCFQ